MMHDYLTSSQMMILMLLSPYMIGDYVPHDDGHWECFLILWDICWTVCAYQDTSNDVLYLA